MALAAALVIVAVPAVADPVGYLVNVTVRPGYNFPNADAALAYGDQLCEQSRQGVGYLTLMKSVQNDLPTTDEYQASYLISQAIDELCPDNIWQLRRSAANYTPGAVR